MNQAFINPELIRWARERSELTTDQLSSKLKISSASITAWETGDALPTFVQAKKLADKLFIPFGYLFLSSPPIEELPLPDLRTVSGEPVTSPSIEFLDLLNDVLRKQQWYWEFQEEEGAEAIPFIGTFTLDDDIELVSRRIREEFSVNEDLRREAINWEDFFRKFVERVEESGILVFRSGIVGNNTHRKLSVEEFRGFAISDPIAPVIFINGKDAKAAQIFTLAHELVHLWIGQSGISKPDFENPQNEPNEIERYCNSVAAEILVPSELFLSDWEEGKSIAENLQDLATRYRVSKMVVLIRAYNLEIVSTQSFTQHKHEIEMQVFRRTERGGGDFYASVLSRNSRTLTTALVSAALEGRVLLREAARLLGIKVSTLKAIGDYAL